MIPKPNIVHEVQSTIALTMEEKIRMFTWDSILAECIVQCYMSESKYLKSYP